MGKNLLIATLTVVSIASIVTIAVRAAATNVETDVRVVAQKLDDGKVEFGVQQRGAAGEWGKRILPRGRFLPTNAPTNRWLSSTPVSLTVEVPEADIATPQTSAVGTGLTRAAPALVGTRVRAGDWEVRVLGSTPDGTSAVMAENQFNDPPRTGWQFYLVEVELTYRGTGSETPFLRVNFAGLGRGNVLRDDSCGVIPDELDDLTELFAGGSITGNICFEAQSSEVDAGGMLLVVDGAAGGSAFDQERRYAALD